MYPTRKVGKNKTIPVTDKEELTEDNIQVAAMKYVSGVKDPLESESEREEEGKVVDSMKIKKVKEVKPKAASQMDMYLKIKQMSLFPSIY